jgi:hypothetical protein
VRGEGAADGRESVRGAQEVEEAANAVLRAEEHPVGGHTTRVAVGDVCPPRFREARAVVEQVVPRLDDGVRGVRVRSPD